MGPLHCVWVAHAGSRVNARPARTFGAPPQRTSDHIWLKPDKSCVSRRRGSSTTSHRFGISLADSLRSQRHKSYASLLPITRGFRAILTTDETDRVSRAGTRDEPILFAPALICKHSARISRL